MKAVDYGQYTDTGVAFVSTNSICQGQQVPVLWPLIFGAQHQITFSHTSFKWKNLAAHNAGVTVAIVGLSRKVGTTLRLYTAEKENKLSVKDSENINNFGANAYSKVATIITPKYPIASINSIILVDRINQLMKDGLDRKAAIVQAGQQRIRPIIMNSLANVMGLLPLTIGFGESASLRSPIALAVIGGLVTSTLLTLVVIPCVFDVMDRFKGVFVKNQ